MTLFLKDEDVAQCVTMDAMLEAIESMQLQYGNGQAHNMTRRKIIAETGMLSVMGGGLFHQGLLGVKTYTVVKGSYSFQVSLYDAETGNLLCYTQANRLGQLPVSAVKESDSELIFQLTEMGRYGRLTQLQGACRLRNAAHSGNVVKADEFP